MSCFEFGENREINLRKSPCVGSGDIIPVIVLFRIFEIFALASQGQY